MVVVKLLRCQRYGQGRGADVRVTANACRIIKLTCRVARDLATWRAFGLGSLQNLGVLPSSRQYLDILEVAFEGALSDPKDRDFSRDLKSQMLQAWRKAREDMGLLPTEMTVAQKRRAKKPARTATTGQWQADRVECDLMCHDLGCNDWMSSYWAPPGYAMPSLPVPGYPLPYGEMLVPEEKSEAMAFHGEQCSHDAVQTNRYEEVLVSDLVAARQREEQLVAELTEASLIRTELTEAALGYPRQLQAMRDEYNALRGEYTAEVHEVQRTRSNAAEVNDTLRRELQESADSQFMSVREVCMFFTWFPGNIVARFGQKRFAGTERIYRYMDYGTDRQERQEHM